MTTVTAQAFANIAFIKYWGNHDNIFRGALTFTKVVALAMQMLDRKPADEPVLTVEEEAVDYEA